MLQLLELLLDAAADVDVHEADEKHIEAYDGGDGRRLPRHRRLDAPHIQIKEPAPGHLSKPHSKPQGNVVKGV